MNPLGRLFVSPAGYYFYDTNKNEMLSISEEVYTAINNVYQNKETNVISDSAQDDIDYLMKNGYLSDKRVKTIKSTNTEFVEYYCERKLFHITLQLTRNCNFRCKYCVYSGVNGKQRSHENISMTYETAKKSLEFLRDRSVDSNNINIGFYGGEPLLEFDLLKKIVHLAETMFADKKLSYSITTNGSLLDDNILEFFIRHNIIPLISLDGIKEINDKSRVYASGEGTFHDVLYRINHIYEKHPDFAKKIQISLVIDPSNEFDCINSFTDCHPAFKDISISPTLVDPSFTSDPKSWHATNNYIECDRYHAFLAIMQYFSRYKLEDISFISRSFLETIVAKYVFHMNPCGCLPDVGAPSGPCIPGSTRLFINVYGDFYPCEKVSEISPASKIGSLSSGFNLDSIKALMNIGQLTQTECKECWAFRLCSICPKLADNGISLSKDEKIKHCRQVKSQIENDLRKYILLREGSIYYKQTVDKHWFK